MRKLFIAPLVLALGSLVGCADSHESLREDTLDAMEEMVEAIEGIKDEASAKAAADKLKGFTEKMAEIEEKMKKLDKLSEEEEEALVAKLRPRFEELEKRRVAAMAKVPPDALKHLGSLDLR